ncbi:MAG: TetR/AcrR family transcriptional regulator [Haliea sp.]|nr:TetR/AcrR family transcriptional regulator [Haliea sp.]
MTTSPAKTPIRNQLAARATPAPRRDARGEKRRRRIYKSLHDCIISKGYVKTTLADIAESAGMTASHLLYYFNGKEAILEQYFANVAVRFLERIESFAPHSAERQVQLLADFWFKGETSTRLEIGFMLECFGNAVNDDILRVTKADFDSRCKAHLANIFASAPQLLLNNANDSAEIAYSMMIGLRSAVYFDNDMSLERAHALFTQTVNKMSGFEA